MTDVDTILTQRPGDGNPLVLLSITANIQDGTLIVCVNIAPDGGSGMPTESVRYCGRDGGRSPEIQAVLGDLWQKNQEKVINKAIDFKGVGGYLCLFTGSGDNDYYLKTHNKDEDVFAGVSVIFPLRHANYSTVGDLLEAMVEDRIKRPIKR